MRERQRCQPFAQRRAHVLELHVGRDVDRLGLSEIHPDAQRALATFDRQRKRKPVAPRGDVGVIEAQVQLALQLVPVLQRFAGHVGAKLDRRGEVGRRYSGQAGLMATESLLETKRDVIEQQLRRLAVFVVPRDQRVTDDDLRLAHQPVRDGGIVGALVGSALDAGEVQPSRRIAAQRKPRTFDQQFLEAQVEERQRRPRNEQVDARQRRAARCRPAARARTRKPRTDSFGFQPSQPVTRPSISTGWPMRLASHCAMSSRRASICRERDEPDREQQRAERAAPAAPPTSRRAARTRAAKDGVDEVAGIMKVR